MLETAATQGQPNRRTIVGSVTGNFYVDTTSVRLVSRKRQKRCDGVDGNSKEGQFPRCEVDVQHIRGLSINFRKKTSKKYPSIGSTSRADQTYCRDKAGYRDKWVGSPSENSLQASCTKVFLSRIFSLYDPLGFVSTVTSYHNNPEY